MTFTSGLLVVIQTSKLNHDDGNVTIPYVKNKNNKMIYRKALANHNAVQQCQLNIMTSYFKMSYVAVEVCSSVSIY